MHVRNEKCKQKFDVKAGRESIPKLWAYMEEKR
jgi:hypothetical protein